VSIFIGYTQVIGKKSLEEITVEDIEKLANKAREFAAIFGVAPKQAIWVAQLRKLYGSEVIEAMKKVVGRKLEEIVGKKELEFKDIQSLVDEALRIYGKTREDGIPQVLFELVYGESVTREIEDLVKKEIERRRRVEQLLIAGSQRFHC
jgi:dephospho-CoA kinase